MTITSTKNDNNNHTIWHFVSNNEWLQFHISLMQINPRQYKSVHDLNRYGFLAFCINIHTYYIRFDLFYRSFRSPSMLWHIHERQRMMVPLSICVVDTESIQAGEKKHEKKNSTQKDHPRNSNRYAKIYIYTAYTILYDLFSSINFCYSFKSLLAIPLARPKQNKSQRWKTKKKKLCKIKHEKKK